MIPFMSCKYMIEPLSSPWSTDSNNLNRTEAYQIQIVELHAIWIGLSSIDRDLFACHHRGLVLNAVSYNFGIPAGLIR